jgi:hypothetical protein
MTAATSIGRPSQDEAAPYYFTYINQVAPGEIVPILAAQLEAALAIFAAISEEKSLYRYAPGKWSIRQTLNHITDTERMFCIRALWFGRGFDTPLPSYEQEIAAAGAEADRVAWARHVEEFRYVRQATVALFANMPPEAWQRGGVASGKRFTVRALAFIAAGHVEHHLKIIRERYL